MTCAGKLAAQTAGRRAFCFPEGSLGDEVGRTEGARGAGGGGEASADVSKTPASAARDQYTQRAQSDDSKQPTALGSLKVTALNT